MPNPTSRTCLLALSPLVLALCAGTAGAATRTDLHKMPVGKLGAQYLAASKGLAAAQAHERHAELIGIDTLSALNQVGFAQDRDGTQHYRYQQTFRGVPVFGEDIVVSEKNGAVKALFGRKVDGLAAEVGGGAARLSREQALDIGKRVALGQGIAAMKTRNEKSDLNIYVDDAGHAHRAYVVSYFAERSGGGDATRPFVILDADTGTVLKQLGRPDHRRGRHRPRRQRQDRPVRVGLGRPLRLPRRRPERQHLHDEQHRREVR